jgi:hypothetical protein
MKKILGFQLNGISLPLCKACDALGGTVKRLAARVTLQQPYTDQIMTPRQLFNWAQINIQNMNFEFVTELEFI